MKKKQQVKAAAYDVKRPPVFEPRRPWWLAAWIRARARLDTAPPGSGGSL